MMANTVLNSKDLQTINALTMRLLGPYLGSHHSMDLRLRAVETNIHKLLGRMSNAEINIQDLGRGNH